MYPSIIEVKKTIWLALDSKDGEAINWTSTKPEFDNGEIKAGTTLYFDHLFHGCGNYMPYGEFLMEDIIALVADESINIK